MTITKLTNLTLLGLITIFISCKNSTRNNVINNLEKATDKKQIEKIVITDNSTAKIQTKANLRISKFVKNLESGKNLSSFFYENWILIYHKDNRCDGSTDGQISNLKSTEIDSIITLQVKNDGEGWACDKTKPKKYNLNFDLRKQIENWDRFEIPNYGNQDKDIIYVNGAGESDYLKIYINSADLIVKMEYRSEDPG